MNRSVKTRSKLNLNRETLCRLSAEQLAGIRSAADAPMGPTIVNATQFDGEYGCMTISNVACPQVTNVDACASMRCLSNNKVGACKP